MWAWLNQSNSHMGLWARGKHTHSWLSLSAFLTVQSATHLITGSMWVPRQTLAQHLCAFSSHIWEKIVGIRRKLVYHLCFLSRRNYAISLIQIPRRLWDTSSLLASFLGFFPAQNCAIECMHAVALMNNGRIRGCTPISQWSFPASRSHEDMAFFLSLWHLSRGLGSI